MLLSSQIRQFKLLVVLLPLSVTGCQSNQASASSAASNDVSISVERLADMDAATRTCELAAAISRKQHGRLGDCLNAPAAMAQSLENEFLNTFQKNPACKGIALIVGTDDPAKASTPEEQQRLLYAKYRLYFHLKVTAEGYVNWDDSDWQLDRMTGDPNPVHGSMSQLEKETTAFCTVVRGEGGSVH
jgi:hypothetical protein